MNRLLALLFLLAALPASADEKPNVLFIPVDDLNHWIGHLGRNPQGKTPNIDRLASSGVSFTRAYCAAPARKPSRAALMSGLRPSSTGVYLNSHLWKDKIPPAQTLNVHFQNAGYKTMAGGKVYHAGVGRREDWGAVLSRTAVPKAKVLRQGGAGKLAYKVLDGGDEVLRDHHVVSWACEQLAKEHDKPFFLACGIFRPHLPWDVPKKYFDMHPLDEIELPPFKADDLADIPEIGRKMASGNGDHRNVTADDPEQLWKELVQAYLASCSFADAQVGRLLDALDASPHKDNTIVVLWGDHGWSLGEKSHWRKFALWEEPTRAPLIWRVPGVTKPGARCETPVDFMNIYPTLCDLAGVEVPGHCDGVSLKPLLADPDSKWERAALTTHGYQNHAIRLREWRYIRYEDGSEELYNRAHDPLEYENLVAGAEYDAVLKELRAHLPKINEATPEAEPNGKRPLAWAEKVARELKGEETKVLFDGKSLAGWDGDEKFWSVDKARGWIVGKNEDKVPSSTYLFTEKKYREFRLLFEVKQVMSNRHSTMHSAVAALGERFEDKGGNKHGFKGPLLMFCHDWGIWDVHRRNRLAPAGHKGTLNIEAENKGKWNQIEMLVKGNRIRVVANGSLVFDFTDDPAMLRESPIGLQLHSNAKPQEFRFKGIVLSEEPGDELATLKP